MCYLERLLTTEERIRRAEEIYQRRRTRRDIKVPTNTVYLNNKKDYIMFKKLIIQVLICLLLYFTFYIIKNSNYFFSEELINKTKSILSYDIDFNKIYLSIEEFYNNNIKTLENNEVKEEKQEDENSVSDNIQEEGIGGGEEGEELIKNEIEDVSANENIEESSNQPLTQMEMDANYIKSNYSLIVPLKGTVTSRFGARTPTDIVSSNHAGIDIGANSGTKFIASMEGVVKEVSAGGGYGEHVYIEKDEIITLYAHCKNI